MNKYRLNDLDDNWIYYADSEKQATQDFLNQMGGFDSVEEYAAFCFDMGMTSSINWKQE